jgi:predicted metal-dependent hydrolase
MTATVEFGSKRIDFHLQFVDRKSLGITVTPDLEVLVKAPINSPMWKIREKVHRRAPWIIKQQGYFLSFYPKTPPRKFISGESHLYLGRNCRLKIVSGKLDQVRYKGRMLEVVTNNRAKVRTQLRQWYRIKAKELFPKIAEPLISRFAKYRIQPSGLFIQEMACRWGSCTPKGKIILNPELIKAPKGCIEYVIIHELCHLVHPNHTQKFFDLQSKEMRDWEKWKYKLEKLLA